MKPERVELLDVAAVSWQVRPNSRVLLCTNCLTAASALWLAISRSGQLFGWKVEVLWKRFACAKTQNHSKLTQLHRIISTKRLLQQLKSSRRTARVKILVSVRRCACENSGRFKIYTHVCRQKTIVFTTIQTLDDTCIDQQNALQYLTTRTPSTIMIAHTDDARLLHPCKKRNLVEKKSDIW